MTAPPRRRQRRIPTTRPPARDTGQAAVEFAIALPVVAVVLLGIVQVLVVGRGQLAVELAARDAARAASVAAAPSAAARTAAEQATSLRPLRVSTRAGDGTVSVTVTYLDPTDVPIVGHAMGDVALTATVTMAREPP